MKNYRFLVPIVIIGLMIASWYVLVNESVKIEKMYNDYLEKARGYAQDGITVYAIENYLGAIDIKNDPVIYEEVAQYYKTQGDYKQYLNWCENFFELFPTNAKSYDCVLDAYIYYKDYSSCYDILEIAEKRGISTNYIEQVEKDIRYAYKLEYSTFDDVGSYSNNLCPVLSDGKWGYVDRYGEQVIGCKFLQVDEFTSYNFAPVVDANNNAYIIDTNGVKVKISHENYKSFGIYLEENTVGKTQDDKYVYLDNELNKSFGNYDYASTMSNGIAAVKEGESWYLINDKGEALSDKKYFDIKVDDKDVAYRAERTIVATQENNYIMIDKNENQIGSLVFEDAKAFISDEPTAVKINGKWCFVDINGKLISDKTYDDARPFVNGLAAVCINGKWGYVDEKENTAIEPTFFGAKDFNDMGSAFVNTGNSWQLLKLYRLNRE